MLLAACASLCGGRASASEPKVTEYEVKAAYLYNLLLFVEWPESEDTSSSGAGSPDTITIGILGKDPFGGHFSKVERKLVKGKNKKLIVRRFGRFRGGLDLRQCQLLFIASSEKRNVKKVLSAVGGAPVLTVSEVSGFLEAGGMINLVKHKGKIRFEINRTPASTAGLRLSSHLLRNAIKTVNIPELPER